VQDFAVDGLFHERVGNFGSDFLYVYGYLFDFYAFGLKRGHGIRFGRSRVHCESLFNSVYMQALSDVSEFLRSSYSGRQS